MKTTSVNRTKTAALRSSPGGRSAEGILLLLAIATSAHAATLRVPADYSSIQNAVDAAARSGDEILIAPGVYTQQTLITEKKLTLTGSAGTVLQAWTSMNYLPGGPDYNLVTIRTNADVVIRNIEFDGKRLAQSMPNRNALLEAVIFSGANGRVESCLFKGFRGVNRLASPTTPPRGGLGYGLVVFNPIPAGTGVIHVQVLNCNFSDNGVSMVFAGDFGHADADPALLRTTFTAQGNTVVGIGPTSLDYQFGIAVLGGASGVIKNNRIIDHQNTTGGYWSEGIAANEAYISLQPLRIEGNTFLGNQKHLVLLLGDNSQIINNVFDGTGSVPPSDGIWLTGANTLTAINLFTNLNSGVVLAADNSHLRGAEAGAAVDPSLFANQFCNVNIPVTVDPDVVNAYEAGTVYCPWIPEGTGNLTCAPQRGLPGTTVTLSGTGLTGATAVLFNGLSAEFTSGADPDRLLTATVPAHATTGPVTVITPEGNVTSLTPFTVPVPLAMSLQPGGLVQLSWCADACDLVLETSPDLATPDWQPTATSPSVGAASVTWTGPVINGAQFFRLREPSRTEAP